MANQPRKRKVPNDTEALILQLLIGGDKYGLQLQSEFERRYSRVLKLGSLYTTLDRMENKGFVKSWLGEDTHERGGNRRRYFRITGEGSEGLDWFREQVAATSMFLGARARGALQ